jgi:hypothetical protein
MKKSIKILGFYLLYSIVFIGCGNPQKELPGGILTGNEWFVESGNPNSMYDASIWLKFQGGSMASNENTVEVWEGGTSTKSCVCDGGHYIINESRNQIVITGLTNSNCPWMSNLNGAYTYAYDASRDGYNKYRFNKGNLVITHLFDENR